MTNKLTTTCRWWMLWLIVGILMSCISQKDKWDNEFDDAVNNQLLCNPPFMKAIRDGDLQKAKLYCDSIAYYANIVDSTFNLMQPEHKINNNQGVIKNINTSGFHVGDTLVVDEHKAGCFRKLRKGEKIKDGAFIGILNKTK